MRATTYLDAAERVTEELLDAARILFQMGCGRIDPIPSPRMIFDGIIERNRRAYNLTEAGLARTDDPYLRDRLLDVSTKANKAAKAASYDVEDAEGYLEDLSA